MTTDEDRRLRAVLAASQRVRDAETALADKRAAYRSTIADAYAAGVSLSAIGRTLGVSRQRVKRIIDGD